MTHTQQRSGSVSSCCLDHPKAKLLLAAVCGLFLAAPMACSQSQRQLASGDEPPIRVRNGSVDLQLLHRSGEWENVGDRKNWKVKNDPERSKEIYEVIVSPTDAARCNKLLGSGDTVTITTGTGAQTNEIQLKLTGKKTKIKSRVDLSSTADLLRDSTAGTFISKIEVGDLTCNFSSPDANLRVVLMDP
jgi:hypothetical protein